MLIWIFQSYEGLPSRRALGSKVLLSPLPFSIATSTRTLVFCSTPYNLRLLVQFQLGSIFRRGSRLDVFLPNFPGPNTRIHAAQEDSKPNSHHGHHQDSHPSTPPVPHTPEGQPPTRRTRLGKRLAQKTRATVRTLETLPVDKLFLPLASAGRLVATAQWSSTRV